MAKRPQPAPGAIYECDRLAHPLFLAIRLYANRLEVDMGTTYLHRYKKTEAYKVSDLQGVTIKKRTVTWKYSAALTTFGIQEGRGRAGILQCREQPLIA